MYISGSVALLADTIHNFADAGTSIPLWIAFALAKRGTSRRYTYGYDIEPEIVQAIEQAATDVPGVLHVHDLRARWLGHRVVAELTVVVDRALHVSVAAPVVERVKESLGEHVPSFGNARVEIRAADGFE